MKIVFICSSLEPGKDGVGDYTRRLGTELIRQGHSIKLLALNDSYITNIENNTQQTDQLKVPVLRLPSAWVMNKKLVFAKAYIDDFTPDWLSLQFVIFGYHVKGLPFGIGRQLASLTNGKSWHIMFHELWVGMATSAVLSHRYWGLVQKRIIKNLINKLNPKIIHTNISLYQAQLKKLGFASERLPLFGNIPYNRANDFSFFEKAERNYSSVCNLVIFATIHPGVPVKQFAADAALYEKSENVKLVLNFIGKCGLEQDHWIAEWSAAGLTYEVFGEQSPEFISNIFRKCSIGISTSSLAMIEKSGAVATMREHNLKVISVSQSFILKGIKELPAPIGILEFTKGNLKACIENKKTYNYNIDVSTVTNQFLLSLINL